MTTAKDLIFVESTSGYVSPKSPVDLEVTFNKLCFSERGLVYRSKLSKSGPRISLWIEEKASLKQWSLEFAEDASDFGPPGVPAAAFFKLFTEALIAYDRSNLTSAIPPSLTSGSPLADEDSTSSDFVSFVADIEQKFLLTFTIRFGEDWENTYSFPLRPVVLTQEALLAGKLRNAEDELRETINILNAHKDEMKRLQSANFVNSFTAGIVKIRQLNIEALEAVRHAIQIRVQEHLSYLKALKNKIPCYLQNLHPSLPWNATFQLVEGNRDVVTAAYDDTSADEALWKDGKDSASKCRRSRSLSLT